MVKSNKLEVKSPLEKVGDWDAILRFFEVFNL